jgi:lysophospholipase L1-like esterase
MSHVVLLGDSIFDNAAYVPGEPDVVRQLDAALGVDASATLRAVDGGRVDDVRRQLDRIPDDATHLVVSAGGNDTLGHLDFLAEGADSVSDVLEELAGFAERFESRYREMLSAVLECRLPTAVCSIYYPRFPEPELQRVAVTALTVFNDAIFRAAFSAGVPVLDLRLICSEASDYSNPIEPSARGGEKIARCIAELVRSHDFSAGRTTIYSR